MPIGDRSKSILKRMAGELQRSPLARGIGSNLYAQAAQILIQLTMVPILVTHWGVARYGVWLLLSTIPSYLSMADLGFASAAANDMTASVAVGDHQSARSIFINVRAFVLSVSVILVVLSGLVCLSLPGGWIEGLRMAAPEHIRLCIFLLAAYGVLSLQNSVSLAGYRAIRAYGLSGYVYVSLLLAEAGVALAVVGLGGGVLAAAVAYVTVRAFGSVLLIVVLKIRAPWLVTLAIGRPSASAIAPLIRPAFAVMALPAAQALFLQGTVIMVGAAAGSAAVPLFTSVRTLSRVAVQFATIINHAIMPEFTVAAARGDLRRKSGLTTASIYTSLCVLVPMWFIIVFFGPDLVHIWTRGALRPPRSLMIYMACMMLINGIWHPISNLILAINKHEKYSYFYLFCALGSTLLTYPLVHYNGIAGAGLALVLLDTVMFIRVWRQAVMLHVVDWRELRKFWPTMLNAVGLWRKKVAL